MTAIAEEINVRFVREADAAEKAAKGLGGAALSRTVSGAPDVELIRL
jgi:hypothetical protein